VAAAALANYVAISTTYGLDGVFVRKIVLAKAPGLVAQVTANPGLIIRMLHRSMRGEYGITDDCGKCDDYGECGKYL
jgi:hypothetical protein